MDDSEYKNLVVRCNSCQRIFTVGIDKTIEETCQTLSKDGCIYCKSEAANKQLEIISIEREQMDAKLTELYANLCKIVTF